MVPLVLTTGLAIDPVTGEINVAGSTSGTYTVSYHLNEDASICQAEGDQTATITIIAGADVAFEQGCEGVNYMITAVPVGGSFNPSSVSYRIDWAKRLYSCYTVRCCDYYGNLYSCNYDC